MRCGIDGEMFVHTQSCVVADRGARAQLAQAGDVQVSPRSGCRWRRMTCRAGGRWTLRLIIDPALPDAFGELQLLDIPGRWGRMDAFGL